MVVHRISMALGEQSSLFGDTLGHLLLVAANASEIANTQLSTATVKTIADYVLNIIPWFYRLSGRQENDFLQDLISALEQCHERIPAMAKDTPGPTAMGAVLTMAYITWPRLYVIHVGNCRCYLQRGGTLEQITTDHTLAQQLVDSGVLPARDSATSRLSSVLWNAIGGGLEDLPPEVYKANLQVGNTLLLCTDGLHKHVSDGAISALLET